MLRPFMPPRGWTTYWSLTANGRHVETLVLGFRSDSSIPDVAGRQSLRFLSHTGHIVATRIRHWSYTSHRFMPSLLPLHIEARLRGRPWLVRLLSGRRRTRTIGCVSC